VWKAIECENWVGIDYRDIRKTLLEDRQIPASKQDPNNNNLPRAGSSTGDIDLLVNKV
jgi:hypothetical protein